jgi:hypothetical protein
MSKIIVLLFFASFAFAKTSKTDSINFNASIDTSLLRIHVNALASLSPPRNAFNTSSLNLAAAYIESTVVFTGCAFREQKYLVKNNEYKNIIVTFGRGAKKPVVIGAHYDVADGQPGADDNASGVAGLLEIVRMLRKYEDKLGRQIEIVFYTLEEPPYFNTSHMGSYIHAKSLADSGRQIELMICLEMIGYYSNEKKSQTYPIGILNWFYPSTGNFISAIGDYHSGHYTNQIRRIINRYTKVPCRSLVAPGFIFGISLSDHRNYWKYNMKALMITDTALFRNHNYHSPDDKPETLDYFKMAEVVKGVSSFLLTL